jgi:hypothetical protein
VIPERTFLWMSEHQRQELMRASRVIVDFAAAISSSRLGRPGRRLLGNRRRPDALPAARVVRR